MKWNCRPEVIMGDFGEALVCQTISPLGIVLYKPENKDVAHPIDRLAIAKIEFMGWIGIFAPEIKTKCRRGMYPDTGVDTEAGRGNNIYERYIWINNHSGKVFLFFCDSLEKKIYGNWLDELEKPREIVHRGRKLQYPWVHGKQRYWPLQAMHIFRELTDEECEKIEKNTTRKFVYGREIEFLGESGREMVAGRERGDGA